MRISCHQGNFGRADLLRSNRVAGDVHMLSLASLSPETTVVCLAARVNGPSYWFLWGNPGNVKLRCTNDCATGSWVAPEQPDCQYLPKLRYSRAGVKQGENCALGRE